MVVVAVWMAGIFFFSKCVNIEKLFNQIFISTASQKKNEKNF